MNLSAESIPSWFAHEWQYCGVRCSSWAGVNDLAAGATTRRRRMGHFTLYVFTQGEAVLRHGSEEIEAAAGRCWLLPPGWTFTMRNPGMGRCVWLEVQLELLLARTLAQHPLYRLSLPAGVDAPPEIEAHLALFSEIRRSKRTRAYDLQTRPVVDALISHYLISGFASGALQPQAPQPEWLRSVLAAIHRRPIQERIRIDDIADEVGIAVSTIQHGLRRHLGRSLSTLQKERRIAEAQHLLASGRDYTVATIAARCGYRSPTLFYRHYRELVGHAPRSDFAGGGDENLGR